MIVINKGYKSTNFLINDPIQFNSQISHGQFDSLIDHICNLLANLILFHQPRPQIMLRKNPATNLAI